MTYTDVNHYLKNKYGRKIYKLALRSASSCPNRDGTKGTGGCIFCSAGGSGDFAEAPCDSVTEQIERAKQRVAAKLRGESNPGYIAYFQAFSSTYDDPARLERIFTEAALHPDVVELSVATRPDCLPPEILEMLSRVRKIKPVTVELGLQSSSDLTGDFLNRCCTTREFDEAVSRLRELGIPSVAHLIVGLPYPKGDGTLLREGREEVVRSVRHVCEAGVSGIKLQLLHVLKGTKLAEYYEKGLFEALTLEEYGEILRAALEVIPPSVVVHRITGDAPKSLLIAPQWSADKKKVLNRLREILKD